MPAVMILSNNALQEELCNKALTSINNADILEVKKVQSSNFFSAVSHVSTCVLKDTRFYDNGNITAWFAGILPDKTEVSWEEIIPALKNKEYSIFKNFSGPFAIAVYIKDTNESFLVSDYCSQYPVFYSLLDNKIIFSTSYKTFFSCLDTKEFDEKWLSDFLIYNFPLNQTTPIKNVYRMPTASVLHIDSEKKITLSEYASVFKANIPSCSEEEMIEKTHEVFSQRIPLYYQYVEANKYASSITSGFDARTTLAYTPNNVKPLLYTYGIAGTDDLEDGKHIAQKLGYNHKYLCIDDEILDKLDALTLQNIDFTAGANPAMRCALVYVYESLAKNGIEGVVTGISADHYFRSIAATPHTLSESIVALVKNPQYDVKNHAYYSILSNAKKANENLAESREFLEKKYDWTNIGKSERLLTFNHYELSTKHYGGELSLAENYLSMSSPYWDKHIRELTFNTNLSTLTITPLIFEVYPYWKQHQLFTSLLMKHDTLKNIKVEGIPPKYYAKGTKFNRDLGRVIYKAPKKILSKIFGKKEEIPQEAWDKWLGEYVLSKLISSPKDMLLAKYIKPSVLEEVFENELNINTRGSKYHLGGKIITAELVLRNFV